MEKENIYKAVERLDAQMPLVRAELSKLHTKADKTDADQRRTMVLFEETDGKFKLTLEGYISVSGRMDNLEGRMGVLEVRMDKLEVRMDKLETEMKSMRIEMKERIELVLPKMGEFLGGRPVAGTEV